jgi:hypothetical protein
LLARSLSLFLSLCLSLSLSLFRCLASLDRKRLHSAGAVPAALSSASREVEEDAARLKIAPVPEPEPCPALRI